MFKTDFFFSVSIWSIVGYRSGSKGKTASIGHGYGTSVANPCIGGQRVYAGASH
jgi:hypothetical protein